MGNSSVMENQAINFHYAINVPRIPQHSQCHTAHVPLLLLCLLWTVLNQNGDHDHLPHLTTMTTDMRIQRCVHVCMAVIFALMIKFFETDAVE